MLNTRVDRELAQALGEQFIEVLFAPGVRRRRARDPDRERKNIRVLEKGDPRATGSLELEIRQVDRARCSSRTATSLTEQRDDMEVVTERAPTEAEWDDLLFAWRVCKHVRSNAIVIARDRATVGIGAGQMSRVDSVRLAVAEGARRARSPAPCSPQTPTSRSPTAPSSRSRRACAR